MPKSVKCFMVKMPKSVKCLPILEEKRKLKSRNILMNLCHNESPKSCCTWEILTLFLRLILEKVLFLLIFILEKVSLSLVFILEKVYLCSVSY